MTRVTIEIVLDGFVEDEVDRMDDMVCKGLNLLDIYPSSVLIDSIEEDFDDEF